LSCRVNSKVPSCDINNIYSASINFDRLGGFCAPNDQFAQEKLIKTANLESKWGFLEIYDSVRLCIVIALVVGLFWSQLVQCFPRGMTAIATVLSIVSLGVMGIILLLDNSGSSILKICVGVILITVAVLFTFFLCFFRKRNRLTGVFIDWSTRLAKERVSYYFFVLLFILMTAGLIVLCLFQHLAFLSSSEPLPTEGDLFLKLTPNTILFVLNIIEFIWGLQFLKDSCTF
jgi:hypothetical protein